MTKKLQSSAQLLKLQSLVTEMNASLKSNPFSESRSKLSNQTPHATETLEPVKPQELPDEEKTAVLLKLQKAVEKSPGLISENESLYIEQQVGELLGFEVSVYLEGNHLTHAFGVMAGNQHIQYNPSKTPNSSRITEATTRKQRSTFGWQQNSEVSLEYTVQNNLAMLPDWNERYVYLKKWFAFRQVVVINPFNGIACIARLSDTVFPHQSKYQFGGSPELIRDAAIWSPEAMGRVWVFLIPDGQILHEGVITLI